jgi:hypothetical protein
MVGGLFSAGLPGGLGLTVAENEIGPSIKVFTKLLLRPQDVVAEGRCISKKDSPYCQQYFEPKMLRPYTKFKKSQYNFE